MARIGLVDTHCHLELIEEEGEGEAAAAISDAGRAGVATIINVGLGPDNQAVLARARKHADVHATVGWHPHQTQPPADPDLERMLGLCHDPKVAAVGEIGLDYHWRPGYHQVPEAVQKESFRRMLRLAQEADLPAVVHNRDAHRDTLEILDEFSKLPVVMHAFSGDAAFAHECVSRGFFLSIAGPITYPNADLLRGAVAITPVGQLLVETDAPFLPPQPWRGRRSRPAMVVETARKVAEVKAMAVEELSEATTVTAAGVFRLAAGTGSG